MKKSIMYHISKSTNWKVGDIITAGVKENPFWLTCADYNPQLTIQNQTMSYFELFTKCECPDYTEDNLKFVYQSLQSISKECSFYIREQVFEDVRKQFFSDKPSRKTCLWVSEKEHLPFWISAVTGNNRVLLTLELEGNVFVGDNYWLTANTFSSKEYSERAYRYWSQEFVANSPKECLFAGTAIVKNIEMI